MFFNKGFSLGLAGLDAVCGTLALAGVCPCKKTLPGKRLGVAICFYYFAVVEIIQFLQQQFVDQCENKMNMLLTALQWAHICFQPVVTNLAFATLDKRGQKGPRSGAWNFIVKFSFVSGLLMFMRMVSPIFDNFHKVGGLCIEDMEPICGESLCTTEGKYFIDSKFKLFKPGYLFPNMSVYLLNMFFTPLIMKQRLASAILFGSVIIVFFVFRTSESEKLSIWCLISSVSVIMAMAAAIFPWRESCKCDGKKAKNNKSENPTKTEKPSKEKVVKQAQVPAKKEDNKDNKKENGKQKSVKNDNLSKIASGKTEQKKEPKQQQQQQQQQQQKQKQQQQQQPKQTNVSKKQETAPQKKEVNEKSVVDKKPQQQKQKQVQQNQQPQKENKKAKQNEKKDQKPQVDEKKETKKQENKNEPKNKQSEKQVTPTKAQEKKKQPQKQQEKEAQNNGNTKKTSTTNAKAENNNKKQQQQPKQQVKQEKQKQQPQAQQQQKQQQKQQTQAKKQPQKEQTQQNQQNKQQQLQKEKASVKQEMKEEAKLQRQQQKNTQPAVKTGGKPRVTTQPPSKAVRGGKK